MLGFFNLINKRSGYAQSLQAYNSLLMVYSIFNYFTNPNATWDEQLVEAFLNAMTVCTLRETASAGEAVITAAANLIGLGGVLRGVTSGSTSMPLMMNTLEGLLHFVSAKAAVHFGANLRQKEDDVTNFKLN